jgi:hypothetical protein
MHNTNPIMIGKIRDLFILHFLSFFEKVNADKLMELETYFKLPDFNKKGPSLPMCFVKNILWQRGACVHRPDFPESRIVFIVAFFLK